MDGKIMRQDTIAKIEIDAEGKLYIVPVSSSFPYIYREAMEVRWDAERRSLYSPKPRDWSYCRWLQQIVAAAREQGVSLSFSPTTEWLNIDQAAKAELEQAIEWL
jgi:hypothetical protein